MEYDCKNKKIAHIRDKKIEQTLQEHLEAVSELCGEFAEKVGLKEIGKIIGLLHDVGKAKEIFQRYILSSEGIIDINSADYLDPIANRGQIDHSTAGAQLIHRQLNQLDHPTKESVLSQLIAVCIASHHSGLMDCVSPDGLDNFSKRMAKGDDLTGFQESSEYFNQLYLNEMGKISELNYSEKLIGKIASLKDVEDNNDSFTFKQGLLLRFLYSCLIDADRTDTAMFSDPSINYRCSTKVDWDNLIGRFETGLEALNAKSEASKINKIRMEISESCLETSKAQQGIFQLTVPTGGGKTLASLRFALHHAKKYNLDHIYYIIPYTSIIDQNAKVIREILEDKDEKGNYLENIVLEHHSNLTSEFETIRNYTLSQRWDAPIILTTQVQFFDTLFGSGTRDVRRLHQLANSVIIFDEVQTVPIRCIHLFNTTLKFLTKTCGSSIVLCTATQPLLSQVKPTEKALVNERITPIIKNVPELFLKLNRVEVVNEMKPGGWQNEEIVSRALELQAENINLLIIVNTKKQAAELYKLIKSQTIVPVFHLSTNMCASHRMAILSEIREKLERFEPMFCVSTQLIEAGIDIDFNAVIRSIAGLDSIIQASGRCNRNGKRSKGLTVVINPVNENLTSLPDIRIGKEVTERIWDEIAQRPGLLKNLVGQPEIEKYYQYYFFNRQGEMGYLVNDPNLKIFHDSIYSLLSMNEKSVEAYVRENSCKPGFLFKQSFQSAAQAFRMIDNQTIGLLVPYGSDGKEIIRDFCSNSFHYSKLALLRKSQRFSVNLFANTQRALIEANAIHETQHESGVYYLSDEYYSEEFGVSLEQVNDLSNFIF